ncbi:sensor histidine kinase [Paenibacillus arenilitoris]|uniref:Histidine kinase n=1 Tax=Paenibacillus arenilitoris TaxID=2772299 RepID=A0A927CJH3_9BACL|nr:histidine kinase [Paenibacillus arenilitoris]MBD2867862.1 histidine kinase [Paenibacillus arenilitoris]
MKFGHSIRTSLIIGFMAVMLPILIFMLINHFTARDIVRAKMTETYRNTLDIFVKQTDQNLKEIDNYLLDMSILDVDVGLLMSFPMVSDLYTLTKIRIDGKLKRDVGVYSLIDTVFLYHEGDTIFGTDSEYNVARSIVETHMPELARKSRTPADSDRRWEVRYDERMPGHYFLMNSVEVTDGLYAGAIIRIRDINQLLSIQWSDGDIGHSSIYSREGNALKAILTEAEPPVAWDGTIKDDLYHSITNEATGKSYLVMNRLTSMASIAYQVIVPEETLLRNLMFFQNVALFAPFGFIVILSLYLIFLRKMLFKPFHELIAGMKKISLGMLDVRLNTGKTMEFAFLGNTFNTMAEQIKTLKIGVYEEQLRVKQGELRQLQAQINPHFYMNSLNIIYNLAALNDTESVKKMSLHLADYFRFIMRANRDMLTLGEELSHIENYITIQKMRFPGKLDCIFEVPEPIRSYPIAALTVQPFVENAIIHGFKNRRKLFLICIKAEVIEEGPAVQSSVRLSITDNGTGFPEDVLRKLQLNQPVEKDGNASHGIINVMHRLSLLYGSTASIQFQNAEDGAGATVTIVFPRPPEGVKPNV